MMGMIKDRNSKDLTEAEEIKKRWQEYREELYEKGLNDPDNHDGVVTQPEPNILEYEIKWGSRRIATNKARTCDGILAELFQILKYDVVKVAALKLSANLENSAVATGQFLFQLQRRAMPKKVQTTIQLSSFHMLAQNPSN